MQLFDSLSVYEQLKHTSLDDETCLRISEILRDSQIQQLELLATKKDIETIRAETKRYVEDVRKDIEILRAETKKDIEILRAETKRDIDDVRKDIEVLRAETKKDIEGVRKDIEVLRAETKKDIATAKSEVIKWAVGLIATQTVLIAGMFTAAVTILLKMIQ
ncbi:MAG: DUF1640 domain-containing protein [Deltaproteobacteria bacterium]|nr:DUF1640 domain-containing protein [Deltaproteobacteria bacterium]